MMNELRGIDKDLLREQYDWLCYMYDLERQHSNLIHGTPPDDEDMYEGILNLMEYIMEAIDE